MLTEEHKRKIENIYKEYYELSHTETNEDMKYLYIGKYLAIEEVLRILGYFVLKGEIRELD